MSLKSIDTEEAAQVQQMITAEAEKARDAIHKVIDSPARLVSWKGNRKRRFDEQVAVDMQRLSSAMAAIDDAANKIKEAIAAFVGADDF